MSPIQEALLGMSILNRIITAEKAAESAEQINMLTDIITGAAIDLQPCSTKE